MNNWKPLTALFHCLCHPFAQQPLQPAAKCKEMDKTLPGTVTGTENAKKQARLIPHLAAAHSSL